MSDETNELEGYTGDVFTLLKEKGIKTWDKLAVKAGDKSFEGILLPRNKFDKPGLIDLKLKNGYNIGLRVDASTEFKVLDHQKGAYQLPEKTLTPDPAKPSILLVGTGGTLASRLDYATGGVIPAFSPGELFTAVPELADISNVEAVVKYRIFSEDATPKHWQELAKAVEEAARKGKDGVVIGHGTDTMSYSAAALSFMLPKLSIPVVLVGSQRSSDRPSSDAAKNLIHATTAAARGDFAEVVICMMGTRDHSFAYLHKGVLVRKMHSSVRHTFRTIRTTPFAKVEDTTIEMLQKDYKKRSEDKVTQADIKVDERVGLVYTYPGIDPKVFDFYGDAGYKGLVIAGTGLGHVPHATFPAIKKIIDKGLSVVMVVQTLWGFTGMNVYETGREELALGIIDGKSMLPETAVVKLMWVLGHEKEPAKIKAMMETNLRGEILIAEPPNGFDVGQGEARPVHPPPAAKKKD
ncbi:MAG: Glu-tRNA(Gln) amidotransferase subunit GatD [Candidatus Lokiarchaeota archaeon]|nr:Glu-tRNA(Gln) amidotransferase subunit GatD [Candidatus Lokiarchaeota archaeon]